jgi:transposase
MRRFVEGVDRSQTTLFPESLDDWIGENNPVRVIDAFVDALDLRALGFGGVVPEAIGRPSYHPAVLLKLYIYGYLNRVQSSRRLEREAGRNVELMWLTGRLAPDHKTIANFRKDNGRAIGQVCAQFVTLCRRLGLLNTASVAIDGSKFKAVNNRDRNFTRAKVERRRAQIEESVARYLQQLDTADRHEPTEALTARTTRLKEKIARLEQEMRRLAELEAQMLASPDQQISLTDPDARSMATSGRGSGVVGSNVQVAVETEHHLIVAHEVTNDGCDRAQLSAMGKEDFVYLPDEDAYCCPAGERLKYYYSNVERGLTLRRYWTTACHTCSLKSRCTTAKERRIVRWEHEEVLEAVQCRLDLNPGAMRQRREVVEHPFGTIKLRMGATHFLMKRLPKVRSEMALHVLAYNLTRVLNILGVQPLMAALRA